MTDTATWDCPSCSIGVSTPYCPACGEGRLRARDLTLHGLLDQVFRKLTNLDARLFRTIRCLVYRPGTLTIRYLAGPRKPYIGPFAFFLLANVLFVAMESLTGSNIFSTPLYQHLHNQPWSPIIPHLVSHRLHSLQTSLDLYAPVFDRAVAANAKSLIILMVPPFALLPAIVFRRSQRPFVAHVVFALHFFAFMLLLIGVALAIPAIDALFGGAGLKSRLLDNGIAVGMLVLCAIHLHLASGRVYGGKGAMRLVRTAVLAVAATGIFLGYRFALLLITLYST